MTDVAVSWLSPTTNERRSQVMTTEQAKEWWDMASYPVQCTAIFEEVKDDRRNDG